MVALATGALGFLTSPIGRIVLILVAFVGWTIYQRDQAADKAREECQAEQIQKVLDETIRQRDAARAALASAQKQAQQTAAEMAALERENAAIRTDLGEAGKSACNVPRGSTDRLRNIR